jgi:hypothetical protein
MDMMTTIRLARLLLLAPGFLLLTVTGAQAQDDKWSFVLTPQVWFSNIPFSGFSPSLCKISNNVTCGGTDPTSTLFPQWGGQIASQHGRWTIGVAAQYVSYETSTNLFSTANLLPQGIPIGSNVGTERISADRVDTDLALSYFVPDVVRDGIDVSLGAGVKWIRVSGHRTLLTGHVGSRPVQLLYTDVSNGFQTDSRSFLDNLYAFTLPMGFYVHLNRDRTWFLPVTLMPMLGYEEVKDEAFRTRPRLSGSSGFKDSFAKGATLDTGVRYVFDTGVAVYAGYRAQVISAVDLYVAHGPLFNVSIRFGGR